MPDASRSRLRRIPKSRTSSIGVVTGARLFDRDEAFPPAGELVAVFGAEVASVLTVGLALGLVVDRRREAGRDFGLGLEVRRVMGDRSNRL